MKLRENIFENEFCDYVKKFFIERGMKDVFLRQQPPHSDEKYKPDLILDMNLNDSQNYKVFFELKTNCTPRNAREAIKKLEMFLYERDNSYGVIGTNYVQGGIEKSFRAKNVGYMDLSGNAYLVFGPLFIEIQGKRGENDQNKIIRKLFEKTASRIIRILLCNVAEENGEKKLWSIKELKEKAKVSAGEAFNVKKLLYEYEFIDHEGAMKSFALRKGMAKKLLDEWCNYYSYKKNKIYRYRAKREVVNIEHEIVSFCNNNKVDYAFTLTTGIKQQDICNVPKKKNFLYYDGDIEKIAKNLELKKDPSGDIIFMKKYDLIFADPPFAVRGSSVRKKPNENSTSKIVSWLQLYLDFMGYNESKEYKGSDIAEIIYEKHIKPVWQKVGLVENMYSEEE